MTALLTVFPKVPAWFCCRDWKCATPGGSVRPISPRSSFFQPSNPKSFHSEFLNVHPRKQTWNQWMIWHMASQTWLRISPMAMLLLWGFQPTCIANHRKFPVISLNSLPSRWPFFLGACSRPRGKIFTTAMQGAGIIHNNLGACWAAKGGTVCLSNAFCLREWKGSLLLE